MTYDDNLCWDLHVHRPGYVTLAVYLLQQHDCFPFLNVSQLSVGFSLISLWLSVVSLFLNAFYRHLDSKEFSLE